MAHLNASINRYYERNIKINSEDRQSALNAWQGDVRDILNEVRRLDVRFSVAMHYTGSFYERSKTSSPDEFDLMLELTELPPVQFTGGNIVAGFTFVTMTGGMPQSWKRDTLVDPSNRLDAVQMRAVFSRLVNQAMQNLNKAGYMDASTHGPAVTLNIRSGYTVYDIDLTLALKLPSWPAITNAWKHRSRGGWPSRQLLAEIDNAECFVVAKQPSGNQCDPDNPFLWRYSLSLAEKAIMKGMDSGIDNSCRKRVLQVLKHIASNDAQLQPAKLTSYHLKTLLFWESERHANDGDWKAEKLGERLLSAMGRLLEFTRTESMQHYFLNQVDLLSDYNEGRLDAMNRTLSWIKNNAEQYFDRAD